MKRIVLTLSAIAFVAGFGACEQHSVANLPPHYKHKLHGHHDDHAKKHDGGESHPKPAGEPEKH